MEDKSTTNLSRLEKIVITVYILYVLFVGILYNEALISIIALLIGIYYVSTIKNNSTNANYLIKERLKLLARHFILLSILWNIILGWIGQEFVCEFSLITTIGYTLVLSISILPFLGIIKAISKVKRASTYKNVDMYRELPQNIEPAIIANLIQEQLSDKSDISATLLDLVRRGYLTIEEDSNNAFKNISDGILDKKLVIKKSYFELKEYERFLISWFSKTSENQNEINMSKLKDMLKDSGDFKANYEKWEKLIKNETAKVDFYSDKSTLSKFSRFSAKWGKRILIISFIILVFVLVGFLSEYVIEISEEFGMVIAIAFFAHMELSMLAIIIYDLRLPEEYLNENGEKWLGFIKFLKEYTLINQRKTEEVHIWQEYLVYGVAFGVAKETIDAMDKAYGFHSYPKK